MVLLHYTKGEKNQFILETKTSETIETCLEQLIEINNLRVKIDMLIKNVQGLANHGPLNPECLRGLTTPETYEPACEMLKDHEKKYAHPKPEANQIKKPDKTGYRIGIAPIKQVADKMFDECKKGQELLKPTRAEQRKTTNKTELLEIMTLIKGSVMIAYPGYHNLPEWDPVYLLLENKLDFLSQYPDCDLMNLENSVLWWAKKELKKQKKLLDYVGKNEKTKLKVKINRKGEGAPLAEAPIDKKTQKDMMAYYYKKQEESKKLEQNEEDDYMNSEWANPNHLKSQLVNGGRGIKFGRLK